MCYSKCASGGGSYDEGGSGYKIGKWINLDQDFNYWK